MTKKVRRFKRKKTPEDYVTKSSDVSEFKISTDLKTTYWFKDKVFSLALKISLWLFKFLHRDLFYSHERIRFRKKTGYWPNLSSPRSFNEKITYRKLHDRNPLLSITVDKYKVRDYVRQCLGDEVANQILIPLLHVTEDPDKIPFDNLPEEYVIKVNHASGRNILVNNKFDLDRKEVRDKVRLWLREPYGFFKHEWAYSQVPRKIIIESMLKTETGDLPCDYKFHMFNGECHMIQVNQGHFADKTNRTLTLFTPEWNKINVFWEFKSSNDSVNKPEHLPDLLEIAGKLASDFDYVRVDLYNIDDQIYFGELTHYPTSGSALIQPVNFDFEVGSKLKLSIISD